MPTRLSFRMVWLVVLGLGLLVCWGCSRPTPKPGQTTESQPEPEAVEFWSAPPTFIVDTKKTILNDRTQIDLKITNDSPHQLSVLEADLECRSLENQLLEKVPVVVHNIAPEESRKLDPIVLDVESLQIASTRFVVKQVTDDKGASVAGFEVVWKAQR